MQMLLFAGASAANAQVAITRGTPNLLKNASFERSADGWRPYYKAYAVNMARYTNPTRSHDGSGFLEMNTYANGGSVAQDVRLSTKKGESYLFSVWLRAAPGVGSVSGRVHLWGLQGEEVESGYTSFTVGQTWTQVAAPLATLIDDHHTLRAEIYMYTTGANFNIDGAQLINAGLQNASFETSSGAWRPFNVASAVSFGQYTDEGRAHEGSGFLEMNTALPSGSIAQDVTVNARKGENYAFSVWLRAAPGLYSVSGTVALWGIGGNSESTGTDFTVGPNWTLVSAPLYVKEAGHNQLRAEIYLSTTYASLDVDGAVLVNAGLDNASFEANAVGWRPWNYAASVNLAEYNNPARSHDGHGFLEMNTSAPGGSVAEDVWVNTVAEQSYSFSVWLRAAPGTNSVSGTLALWGLLGTEEEHGSTNFTVGENWTLVTVPLDPKYSHPGLRAEIYMSSPYANFNADGATLNVVKN